MSDLIEKIVNWTVIILIGISGLGVWMCLYINFPEWHFTTVLVGLVVIILVLLALINWRIEIVDWFNGE